MTTLPVLSINLRYPSSSTQASLMKEKLDAVGTPTEILSGYSSGHAVPQTTETLQVMYDFLTTHIPVSPDTRIDRAIVNHAQPSIPDATYNLMGSRVGPSYKGLVIRSGRQVVVR